MRLSGVLALLEMCFLLSCSSKPVATAGPEAASRVYYGIASAGDFLTVAVDSGSQTIAYADASNGTSGTVPYAVNADGTYTLNDPIGNLVGAYEVPHYAMLIQAARIGLNRDTPALIIAFESGQISLATFQSQSYNFIQFRTVAGGMEVGSLSVDPGGRGTISSFRPYGSHISDNRGQSPFHDKTFDFSRGQLDASGMFLKLPAPDNPSVFDFVTAGGIFAVDTANGVIIGSKRAASKSFDPATAGTYKAIFYQKTNASITRGNKESGTASLRNATLAIASNGQMTVKDSKGNQIMQATLDPVADASYLYGNAGQLSDCCYGLFTFRVATLNSKQDVFVVFIDRAMLFASFSADLPFSNGGTYAYLYGVALK